MMTHGLTHHKHCQERHTCRLNFISNAVLHEMFETKHLLLQAKKQHGEGQVAKAELQQAHQEALQALHVTSARAQEAATAAQQQSAAAGAELKKVKEQLLTCPLNGPCVVCQSSLQCMLLLMLLAWHSTTESELQTQHSELYL